MPNPDWSKVDVSVHQDSPWLTTPPTEKALAEYCPDTVFYRSEVRDAEAFVTEVGKCTLFGHPKDVQPIKPPLDSFIFKPEELSTAPAPPETVLIPPKLEPHHPEPPRNFLHPRAGIFTLKKTSAYQRGYVYTTPYYISSKEGDRERMMRVVAPSQLYPRLADGKYIHDPVPECVQMVPGVPFAFEIDSNPDQLHTIGAVHTLESLRHEPDFWPILRDTVLVAKGLRGCRPVGNTDEIFPISDFPIRPNDRSPTDVPLDSKEGSYNLANTVLKGIGPGVVVPAAQFDTPEFAGQVYTVLKSLGSLRRRLLRKTLSKYEYDVTEFNADDMNVVGFGGLEPNNATSCQLNLSTPWQRLMHALGQQGTEHLDEHNAETRKTFFLALLNLPPDSDSGSFLLARAGVYIREINAWALYLFFDGVDIHTGIGATTTYSRAEFKQWMEADLEMAWNRSELGRMGIVQYASRSAHSRDTYMSMTPSVRFGNCAPEQHLAIQRNFATHGQEILGGQEPWANRMGHEIIYAFWNKLQLCNLDLGIDLNKIIQSISFKDKDGHDIPLQPLPFHPVDDAKHIALSRLL